MAKNCCFCLTSIRPDLAFMTYPDDDLRQFDGPSGEKVHVCSICQHQITQHVLPLVSSFNILKEATKKEI